MGVRSRAISGPCPQPWPRPRVVMAAGQRRGPLALATLPPRMISSRRAAAGVLLLLVGCTSGVDSAAPAADAVIDTSRPEFMPGSPSGDAPDHEGDPSAAAQVEPRDSAVATTGVQRTGPSGEDRPSQPVADPVRVEVPTIGVVSDLVELGLNEDRTMEVPSDFDRAGWFTGRPPPGAVGPAVIVGHVDSRDGPAVFYRLRDLAPGDEILVHRADASTARFAIDRVEQYPKDDFPTEAVYGPTDDAALRLITCGGSFDRQRSSYDDNVVVFATLLVR